MTTMYAEWYNALAIDKNGHTAFLQDAIQKLIIVFFKLIT